MVLVVANDEPVVYQLASRLREALISAHIANGAETSKPMSIIVRAEAKDRTRPTTIYSMEEDTNRHTVTKGDGDT